MMTRTEKEKMLAGELYNADAPEPQAEMAVTYKWLVRYNAALGASASDLRELLLERLATVGEGAMIRPPLLRLWLQYKSRLETPTVGGCRPRIR